MGVGRKILYDCTYSSRIKIFKSQCFPDRILISKIFTSQVFGENDIFGFLQTSDGVSIDKFMREYFKEIGVGKGDIILIEGFILELEQYPADIFKTYKCLNLGVFLV